MFVENDHSLYLSLTSDKILGFSFAIPPFIEESFSGRSKV